MAMTIHWRPTEHSLARESFNDLVRHKKTNVPAILQRSSSMSRLAMRGQDIFRAFDGGMSIAVPRSQAPQKDDRAGLALRSVQFNDLRASGDGFGSIRLGTPTIEPRSSHISNSTLDRSCSMPVFRKTPAARYGFMPPECGRIYSKERPVEEARPATPPTPSPLPPQVLAKVENLFNSMDLDHNGDLTREEAKKFFKRFANISVNAMFNEVDEDANNSITSEEFRRFWEQVFASGYSEEDLEYELDELLQGNVWVDYADNRDVGAT